MLRYRISPGRPEAHVYTVEIAIEAPDPAGQILSLPAWAPGSYKIRDFARHVMTMTAEGAGRAVMVAKTGKHHWRLSPVAGPVVVRYAVYAFDRSVRGAFLDGEIGHFNGACLYLRVHGQDDAPLTVCIEPPECAPRDAWSLVTALDREDVDGRGFGTYRAASWRELIDHPVMMGEIDTHDFELRDLPHTLALPAGLRVDAARLVADVRAACAAQLALFDGEAPFDRYVFLLWVVEGGYGGLEHARSTSLMCARADLPLPGRTERTDGYRGLLGLFSHEYFHAWHVKAIHPSEFAMGGLDGEVHTTQLWIFEGITSYYDDLALCRAGLLSPEDYLDVLARSLTRFARGPGRLRQTLEAASFDAWIKFYQPDENTPNATVSYYLKGSLVALLLDLSLRRGTQGRVSLDTVMRVLWARHGRTGRALDPGAFEALAQEVSGLDLTAFFDQALRSTDEPDLAPLLADFGVELVWRARCSADDKGGVAKNGGGADRPWAGFLTEARNGAASVSFVAAGGPAERAGIAPNDLLVAIEGHRVEAQGVEAALARHRPGEEIEVHFFRDGRLRRVALALAPAPRDTAELRLAGDAPAEAKARRAVWLGAPASG